MAETAPPRRRRRLLGKRIRRLAFVVLLLLVGFEVVIRFVPLVPDTLPVRYREMPGDEAFAPRPGSEGTSLFGIHHRANSLGLRGPERPLDKPPGTTRVAVLGDSVTWGYGVEEPDGFVHQLEQILDDRGAYEVWNLGLQATNTYNQRARYDRLGPQIRPDVTLLLLLVNDLEAGPTHFRITSVGTLSNPSRNAPFPDWMRPALESCGIYQWLLRSPFLWRRERRLGHVEDPSVHWDGIAGQLDLLLARTSQIDSPLVVALMADREHPAEGWRAIESQIADWCAAHEVPFVSLGDVLGVPGDERWFLAADPIHPNPEGHRLIAEALAPLVP